MSPEQLSFAKKRKRGKAKNKKKIKTNNTLACNTSAWNGFSEGLWGIFVYILCLLQLTSPTTFQDHPLHTGILSFSLFFCLANSLFFLSFFLCRFLSAAIKHCKKMPQTKWTWKETAIHYQTIHKHTMNASARRAIRLEGPKPCFQRSNKRTAWCCKLVLGPTTPLADRLEVGCG